MSMSGFEQISPLLDYKNKKWWQFLGTQILIFCAIQVSYSLSNFYVIAQDRVHVLSFTAAFVVAVTLRYNFRVLPTIIVSLLFYYTICSERPFDMALMFALFLPALPLLFCQLYRSALKHVAAYNFTVKLSYFALFIGILYPIANTALLLLISVLLGGSPNFSFEFIAYSVLSAVLTQMVLTPLLSLGLSYVLDGENAPYLKLDRAMMSAHSSPFHFRIWVMICALFLVGGISTNNPLTLNTLSLILLCLVGMGLGKFGLIRPMLVGAATLLICVFSIINRFNAELLSREQVYAMLLVLFVLTMLTFMLGAHTIKNYVTTRNAIRKERIDSFTGLYNLAQLKEDVAKQANATVIYIDLEPTLSKLNGLGHQGRAQLMKQLSQYLASNTEHLKRAYLPPFASGLLCIAPRLPDMDAELETLIALLDRFYFYFDDKAISLVKRTIQCASVYGDKSLDPLISKLCEQQGHEHRCVNWITQDQEQKNTLDQLSFIQQCFRKNEFELYCQPYRALSEAHQAANFEILLRLRPSEDTLMSPGEFFPLINEFGLELELDNWVIEHTFLSLKAQIHDWRSVGRCSINLTAKALNSEGLAEQIQTKAALHEIPMNKLCFEITESDALCNEPIAIQNLNLLRKAGSTIALDDFGTGYASFDYLRRLPLDVLKVDGSFVKDIVASENDRIIVQAISQVARSMNLVTVAEFVESEAHIETLRALNIQFAQGFGVSKPIPLSEHLTMLSNKA
ncbi:Cyclic di-GMP phosphodiesterase YfgF [Vibrio campbellii]|uniref:EAL domain-containing protein n=1 Tax=Vibrio campbellii TaxID=680 RepID=UPI00097FADB7|nr:Cyclic di-GMP phosphodiesterase YfgF [Vibrio campbellii]